MAGHRLEEIFKDRDVFDLNKAYLGGIGGTAGFTADQASNAFMHDRPKSMGPIEFVRMLKPLVKDIPSLQEGRRRLKAYIAGAINRLTERKKLVGDRQERRLVAALNTAQAPVDRAAVTRARYANDSDRILFNRSGCCSPLRRSGGSMGTLTRNGSIDEGVKGEPMADSAQSDEPREVERNDEVIQAPDGANSAVVEALPRAEAPAENNQIRNEAVAPEVAGPIGGYNEISPAPAVSPAAPAATGLDALEAVIAKYNKVIDEMRAHDPLE